MTSSIINDGICSLIHKKYHLKCYHSDINYHMTLNIVYSIDNVIDQIERLAVFWGDFWAQLAESPVNPTTQNMIFSVLCTKHVDIFRVFFFILRYILQSILKWLQSWTSTSYFSNSSTGSSVVITRSHWGVVTWRHY